MYISFKLRSKHVSIIALFVFLLFLPFRGFIEYLFFFTSQRLLINPLDYSTEVNTLKKEKIKLLFKLKKFNGLKVENEKLKKVFNFKKEKGINLIGVRIVSFDSSIWRRIVSIDIGKNKGVSAGSLAIDEDGWIVGKIIKSENSSSLLMFVSDPNFTLPVFVGESSFGLLKGTLGGVKVLYVENDNVKVKDKVWVKDVPFDLPLYIGEVNGVYKSKNSLFWNIDVKLFSKNPMLHKIFIISGYNK